MLIIDCYNVLHTTMPPMLAGLDEGQLCEALARTEWARRGVVVVADGRPKPLRAQSSPADPIELVYSGPSRDADRVIIDMVNQHSAPRRVTVVSTDRQIRAAARRRRCGVWTSKQFITKLVEQLRKGGGVGDTDRKHGDALTDEETQSWLDEFGIGSSEAIDPSAKPPVQGPPSSHGRAEGEDDPFNIPGVWPPPGMGP